MTPIFKVYAQTRATRQDLDDIIGKMEWDDHDKHEYEKVRDLLEDAERILERMDLK